MPLSVPFAPYRRTTLLSQGRDALNCDFRVWPKRRWTTSDKPEPKIVMPASATAALVKKTLVSEWHFWARAVMSPIRDLRVGQGDVGQ